MDPSPKVETGEPRDEHGYRKDRRPRIGDLLEISSNPESYNFCRAQYRFVDDPPSKLATGGSGRLLGKWAFEMGGPDTATVVVRPETGPAALDYHDLCYHGRLPGFGFTGPITKNCKTHWFQFRLYQQEAGMRLVLCKLPKREPRRDADGNPVYEHLRAYFNDCIIVSRMWRPEGK